MPLAGVVARDYYAAAKESDARRLGDIYIYFLEVVISAGARVVGSETERQ